MIKAMAALTRSKVLRNRKPSQPHLNPDYPVKPKIDPETARHYTVVSVRLKAGSFPRHDRGRSDRLHAQASSRPLAETPAICTSRSSRRSRTGTRAGR